MKKNLLIGFILIVIPMMFLARVSTRPKWTDKKIEVKELLKIGEESFEDERYSFGNIMDIAVTPGGGLVVIDSKTTRVLRYSTEGQFLHFVGKGLGEGPGEFVRPWNVAVDKHGYVYLTDHGTHRLSIFNAQGDFVTSFKHRRAPMSIVVDDEGSIFLGYWQAGPERKYIYKYNREGRELAGFCQPDDSKLALLVEMSGSVGTLCSTPDGNLAYTFSYPYETRIFNRNGDLLKRFSRRNRLFLPPEKAEKLNLVKTRVSCWGVKNMPGGEIVNLIGLWSWDSGMNYTIDQKFDLFDKNGEWLLSIPVSHFNTKFLRTFAIDQEGNLFIPFWDPYPHVKKFSLKFQ